MTWFVTHSSYKEIQWRNIIYEKADFLDNAYNAKTF